MNIRVRMTLWYAGMILVSIIGASSLSYYEFITEGHDHRYLSLFAADGRDESGFTEIMEIIVSCAVPALAFAVMGGWVLMKKSLQPVRELTEAASRINEDNLKARLPRSGNGDEIDRLGEVFNEMTTRLDNSFRRVHEFTLHASHELKTPLTILRAELESALRSDELPLNHQTRVASELDEVQRLAQIVDGLSFLTKVGAGQSTFTRDRLRFDDLVRDAYEDALVLAAAKKITVTLMPCEALWVLGDRHRLRQLLLNLTDNAIKHNVNNGQVVLEIRREGDDASLRIENTGPGIPAEWQARVFEPFFRGDSGHTGTDEGSGLGLSICHLIVQGHAGQIALLSEPGVRTEVTVTLPLATGT